MEFDGELYLNSNINIFLCLLYHISIHLLNPLSTHFYFWMHSKYITDICTLSPKYISMNIITNHIPIFVYSSLCSFKIKFTYNEIHKP